MKLEPLLEQDDVLLISNREVESIEKRLFSEVNWRALLLMMMTMMRMAVNDDVGEWDGSDDDEKEEGSVEGIVVEEMIV